MKIIYSEEDRITSGGMKGGTAINKGDKDIKQAYLASCKSSNDENVRNTLLSFCAFFISNADFLF